MPAPPSGTTISGMGVIVVATDGSAAAAAALGAAIDLAAMKNDRLGVITVWRALQHDFGVAYSSGAVLDDLLRQERTHAESTLADARELATAAGVEVDVRLATGDPADGICAYAEELGAWLIAIGTHGYGKVTSLLMGSVSADVIRRWRRPVLVVPEPVPHEGGAPAAPTSRGRPATAGVVPPKRLAPR